MIWLCGDTLCLVIISCFSLLSTITIITKQGRKMVPAAVKAELLQEIRQFLSNNRLVEGRMVFSFFFCLISHILFI